MSAVDLEALGLSPENAATNPYQRVSSPGLRFDKTVEVDVDLDDEKTKTTTPIVEDAPKKKEVPGGRHKTVALTEEDLEEVRAATQQPHKKADSNATMPLAASDVEALTKDE